MIPPKRFRFSGLEGKRLGMFRIEMSSGSSGTVDSITVDSVELLDPDGNGADVITYATSLANTAKLVANKINEGSARHGFWARAGIASTLSEVFVYQMTPGAITGAVVLGATTLVIDFKYPSGGTDNTVYGDTDSWVDLPLATPLAADDYGAAYLIRVKDGLDKKVLRALFIMGVASLLWEKDSNGKTKPTLEAQASSIVKPNGLPLPASVPVDLPVEDWFPGVTERVLGTSVVAGILDTRYALKTR
mgnify:CR=1 FL=1